MRAAWSERTATDCLVSKIVCTGRLSRVVYEVHHHISCSRGSCEAEFDFHLPQMQSAVMDDHIIEQYRQSSYGRLNTYYAINNNINICPRQASVVSGWLDIMYLE